MGALASFYANVKVAHVEAGLRTGSRRNPFPEEMNRRLVACLADIHFAPMPRRVLGYCASFLFRLVFPTPGVRDCTCGFRTYQTRILKSAFTR